MLIFVYVTYKYYVSGSLLGFRAPCRRRPDECIKPRTSEQVLYSSEERRLGATSVSRCRQPKKTSLHCRYITPTHKLYSYSYSIIPSLFYKYYFIIIITLHYYNRNLSELANNYYKLFFVITEVVRF